MKTTTKIVLGFVLTIILFIVTGIITTICVKSIGINGINAPLIFFPILVLLMSTAISWGKKKAGLTFEWSLTNLNSRTTIKVITIALVTAFITGTFLWWLVEKLGVEMGERHEIFSQNPLLLIVSTIILAPLGEELLFRGFLQNMLEGWKNHILRLPMFKLSLPVIISAVMFSLFHLILFTSGMGTSRVFLTLISSFFVGIVAGYFQEKHENFIYAVLVHISANILPITIQLITG